jgi:hypothetical protein
METTNREEWAVQKEYELFYKLEFGESHLDEVHETARLLEGMPKSGLCILNIGFF